MILLTYGTRPEYIKIKPLIDEMVKRGIPFKTLSTGQHKDIAPSDADFNLDFKDYGGNRLDSVIKNCLSIPEKYFDGITYILVQGDTTSVVGLALAAFHRKIKVIHLEAGLRSFDNENPYPEENNRKLVSSIADIHLCPTQQNMYNLWDENLSPDKTYLVGNTVLDNLVKYKSECEYADKVLITLHRRENHKDMNVWFYTINEIAKNNPEIEFIIPLHPNPNVQKWKKLLTHITVVDSMDHNDLVKLLVKCKLVITDSGGLQEECSFFNKKCLVCRKVTERPESIGLSSFMVKGPWEIKQKFYEHINDYKINMISPYGDGDASKKICDIMEKF